MTVGPKRLRDWRKRLSTFIEEKRSAAYPECGTFVADAVMAMTGVDVAAAYRGRFKTLDEAIAVIKSDGYPDLCALLAAHFEEISPALARAGDIFAFPSPLTGWAAGIVNGETVFAISPRGGIGSVHRTSGSRAFRVPQ